MIDEWKWNKEGEGAEKGEIIEREDFGATCDLTHNQQPLTTNSQLTTTLSDKGSKATSNTTSAEHNKL